MLHHDTFRNLESGGHVIRSGQGDMTCIPTAFIPDDSEKKTGQWLVEYSHSFAIVATVLLELFAFQPFGLVHQTPRSSDRRQGFQASGHRIGSQLEWELTPHNGIYRLYMVIYGYIWLYKVI